jgi:ATP-binding cassette subfamily B protein
MRGGMGGRLSAEVNKEFKLRDLNKDAIKILKENLKGQRKDLIIAMLLTLFISGTHVALPILTKTAIDDHILAKETTGLILIVIIYIGLSLIQWMSSYKQMYLAQTIGHKTIFSMRNQIHNHLMNLDIDFHNNHQVGDLSSVIMNDVETIYNLISQGFIYFISDIVTLSAISVALFVLNTRLALTLLITIPFILLSTKIIGKIIRKAQREVRENIAGLTSGVQQNISGIKTVKSFSKEVTESSKISDLSEKTRNANIKAVAITALHFPIMDLAGAVGLALIIWQGGILLKEGFISLGLLMAAVSYVRRIFGPLMDLSQIYTTYQTAGASLDRISRFLDYKPTISYQASSSELTNLDIKIQGLDFAYDNKDYILKDVNLVFEHGSRIGIIGGSGAGKSTLIKVLSKLYNPTKGDILFGETPLRDLDKNTYKNALQVLPQDTHLFPLTVWENIAYGLPDKTYEDVLNLIRQLDLEDFFARLDKGLNTNVGEGGKALSGGQKQAVAIARAMMRNPDILILDEAASNLDSQIEKKIYKYIKEQWENKTLIIITHRITSLDLVDKIYEVKDKKVFEIAKREISLAGWENRV